MQIFKNRYAIFNILNGLIPLIGILFLNWSVFDIFVLFIIELLLLGVFTILKILFSGVKSGEKWASLFMFCLFYPIAFIFIFVLLGNFFNSGSKQMDYSLSNYSIYFLLVVYAFNFVFLYIIKGVYKISPKKNS